MMRPLTNVPMLLAFLVSCSHAFVIKRQHIQWKLPMSTVSETTVKAQHKEHLLKFLNEAREFGPIGVHQPELNQKLMKVQAKELSLSTDPRPARIPLVGTHNLMYSDAPGNSSGKLAGPFYGKVTQEFVDDTIFINAVEFGPLKIALQAEREILSDTKIRVKFVETTIELFGIELVKKETSGAGTWEYLYSGILENKDGTSKRIRIMNTPSLFVLEGPVEPGAAANE